MKRRSRISHLFKALKRCVFFLFLVFLFNLFFLWQSPSEVARLVVTGNQEQEEVEWKMPSSPLQKKTLTAYEVILYTADQQEKAKTFFYGDLIGISYKTLELHPFLHFLGCKDLYELEVLESSYLRPENKRQLPTKCLPLLEEERFFQTLWKKLFFKQELMSSKLFIRKASLKTEYFPLTHPATYILENSL